MTMTMTMTMVLVMVCFNPYLFEELYVVKQQLKSGRVKAWKSNGRMMPWMDIYLVQRTLVGRLVKKGLEKVSGSRLIQTRFRDDGVFFVALGFLAAAGGRVGEGEDRGANEVSECLDCHVYLLSK